MVYFGCSWSHSLRVKWSKGFKGCVFVGIQIDGLLHEVKPKIKWTLSQGVSTSALNYITVIERLSLHLFVRWLGNLQ